MKINTVLIVTREYAHPDLPTVGGTGIFYATLAHKLIERGIDVTVFGTSKKAISFLDRKVRVHFVKDIFKRNPLLEMARSLTGKWKIFSPLHHSIYRYEKKIIGKQLSNYLQQNQFQPDIVETHDFDGLALSVDPKIPVVIRTHGSWTVLQEKFGYSKVHKGRIYSERLAFQKISNVIAISEYSAEINSEIFDIPKPTIIYNGIDTNFFRNTTDEIIQHSIFYFGNISLEKGAETALEVFLLFLNSNKNASLHFIGKPGELQKELQQKILDLKLEDRVKFYGNQEQEEAIRLLSRAHVVIFPSKGENFGLSLIEVMSLKKPVICSDLPVFREIITEEVNGIIATNPEEFAEGIRRIFEDYSLANLLASNARKTVEKKFSVEIMVEKTLDYYNSILHQS